MQKSTKSHARRKASSSKPPKPYRDFPLFAHQSGRWAKRVNGKVRYFGRWGHQKNGKVIAVDDVEASARQAAELYDEQREDLHAGNEPEGSNSRSLTLEDLCQEFLKTKERSLNAGELTDRSFRDYFKSCRRLVRILGARKLVERITHDDLNRYRSALAETLGPNTRSNEINRARGVFKFCDDYRRVKNLVAYKVSLKRPSKKILRQEKNRKRALNGPRTFEASELRAMIDEADTVMLAMILLGINCALGNSDIANLPKSALDFKSGWLNYPRPKTGIERRIPLWPQTVTALKAAIGLRPNPKDSDADGDCVFLTRWGRRWTRTSDAERPEDRVPVDGLAPRFAKLLKRLGVNGSRGFYCLRHTVQTIGGDAKDLEALSAVMGHVDSSIGAVYRDRIPDDRLHAIVETIRAWLFGEANEGGAE